MPHPRRKYRHKHKYPKFESAPELPVISIDHVKYATIFLVVICLITFLVIPGGSNG